MDEEAVKKLLEAGRIARIVREEAARIARPGMKLLDLAEYAEKRIRELGAEPAFPVNLSINDVAAHYTPLVNDKTVIPDGSILKIDIGVHIDGYIADTAVTVSFNPIFEGLLEASRNALEKALEAIKPGIRVNEIGKVIEETIKSYGFQPIRNLTGHSIDKYMIHSGKSIPNYNDLFTRWKISDGVYAIEPFATNGVGLVREGGIATIYALKRKIRGRYTQREVMLYNMIWRQRQTLPFCERWYRDVFPTIDGLRATLKLMSRHGLIHEYPVLVEKSGGMVAQFEHTIIVYRREVIVTTR